MILLITGLVLGFLLGVRLFSLMISHSAETGRLYKGRFRIIDLTKAQE